LKLSPEQKRVAIAQDVIEQITLGKYQSRFCGFIYIRWQGEEKPSNEESLQKVLPNAEYCDVCALGGMFVSCTRLNNRTKVLAIEGKEQYMGDVIRDGEIFSNQLNEIFSNEQLMLIEIAFEEGHGSFNVDLVSNTYLSHKKTYEPITPEVERARKFGNNNGCPGRFFDRRIRMKKIMENIIQNNGRFIP
jgi:rubredoxin